MVKPENENIIAEAKAFDVRITERVNAGFIPDLRRSVKCNYFYKSFWRDPHFISLYLGDCKKKILDLLKNNCGTGLKILDVGCGAGYMSLELAREGYHIVGIDISTECIKMAINTLEDNPYKENFGSLTYKTIPFHEITGTYDVVLFGGSLHHMSNLKQVINKVLKILNPGGYCLCQEPCHEKWTINDATQVALIRSILSITNNWYEAEEIKPLLPDEVSFTDYINDIHREYVTERDKNEAGGQSPLDNSSTGKDILEILRNNFKEIEYQPGFSFIYRLIGGLRGPDEIIYPLADFLTLYDSLCVKNGTLQPNNFFWLGQKK